VRIDNRKRLRSHSAWSGNWLWSTHLHLLLDGVITFGGEVHLVVALGSHVVSLAALCDDLVAFSADSVSFSVWHAADVQWSAQLTLMCGDV
jgi:hypothetical protein